MIVRDPESVISAVRSLEDEFNVEQVFIGESLEHGGGRGRGQGGQHRPLRQQGHPRPHRFGQRAAAALLARCLPRATLDRSSDPGAVEAGSPGRQRTPARRRARDPVAAGRCADADHRHRSTSRPRTSSPTSARASTRCRTPRSTSPPSRPSLVVSRLGEPGQHRPTHAEPARSLARRRCRTWSRPSVTQRRWKASSVSTTSPPVCGGTRSHCSCSPVRSRTGCGRHRVPVGDVVRAALSEIENYGRVELGDLGDGQRAGRARPRHRPPPRRAARERDDVLAAEHQGDGVRPGVPERPPAGDRRLRHRHGADELEAANETLRRHADFDKLSGQACSASRWSPDSRPDSASRCR